MPEPTVPGPRGEEVQVARFAAGPKVREWARTHGFADWMVSRLVRLVPDTGAALAGLLRRPPRYLRVNPIRSSVAQAKGRLESRGFLFSRTDLDERMLRVRQAPISPGATLEHMLGMTILQDLASASAPLALGARPGDAVADLAAAPGVKTLHLAGDLWTPGGQRGSIVAVEPDGPRLRALRFNLERGGATTVVVRSHAAQETPGEGWADRVLVDAPCSGEGTIPKDKERRMLRMEELAQWCRVQQGILEAADRILRPGGTLVYATCTFAPEENEFHLQRLVERGYKVEALPFARCGGVPLLPGVTEWAGTRLDASLARAARFVPGIHPTLGFFVAKLRKGDA